MSLSSIKVNNDQVATVDDEPILGSGNLVKSGGVFDKLMVSKITITSAYIQQKGYTSIFNLPRNKIYVIGNDVPKSFGLPIGNLYATILIYFPDTNPGKGFTVYEYSARVSGRMVRYAAFTFHDDQELSWNKVELDIDYNNIVTGYSIDINADYIQQHPDQDTFLKLPKNNIYVINGNVPESFGLPHNGSWGTLEIVSPNIANQSNTGFRICTLCLQKSTTNFEYWWAFTSVGQAASDVVWYRVPNMTEIINSDNFVQYYTVEIGSEYIQKHPEQDTFLKLPINRIYLIQSSTPSSFGLPKSNWGTLEIVSPYLVNPNTGFRICKYICQTSSRDYEYYWCLTSQNQVASDVKWFKIQNHKTKVSKLRNLGIITTRIILLGDSIVDGYGSSDHNGGYSGPGPIIPITDWEWHRNTGHKCWGNMFVDYITSTYSNAVCVNNGIGAFRTNQVYNNLGTLAYDDDGNLADVIILAIGTNNMGSSDKTADVTNYLKDIAQWCFDRDIELILLTNSPVRGYQNAEYAIQSAILKAAEDFGINHINVLSEVIYYLDDHNLTKDDFLHDALHPNDLGYEIMFKIIRKELQV